MWPEPGEALDRTIAAEQAIEDLHSEAFARWAPVAAAAALPVLAGGAVLPPDLAALSTAAVVAQWALAAETVIIPGIALLWAAAVIEAMQALNIPLPDVDPVEAHAAVLDTFDERVLQLVDRATGLDRDELRTAAEIVESSPPLREARNTVLESHRANTERTVAVVQEKAVRAADAVLSPEEPVSAPDGSEFDVPEVQVRTVAAEREAVAQALTPGSPELQAVARAEGYEAADVLNNAVITAAMQRNEEFGENLHKCWIATLDGRTRPSHWAADGQRVPLDGYFTVGGSQLFVPGDKSAPPEEWKNCRCRVGVLAADEDIPDEVDRHTERLDGRDSVAINRDGRTQAEEIERRRAAGNVRARDDEDGIGRVASADFDAPSEQENDMADIVIGGPTEADLAAGEDLKAVIKYAVMSTLDDDQGPDFASAITALVAASTTAEPRLRTYDPKMFEDPKLTRPTAPSMNNETGRIYGHLAEWGHVIRGGRDVTPRNRNGYRNFHTGQVQLDNGRQLSVGRLTVQGGHASTESGVTAAAARAHYDDVSTAFGLVRVGEDRFGIWFSGVPYPGVDPDVFQQGMVTQLSGDWRDCDGYPLDMIAAHAVNTQGFPIYSAMTGPDGRELALVASLGPVRRMGASKVLVEDDVRAIVAEALLEERNRAALAARRDAALTAALAAVGDPPTPLTPTERIAELIEALPKA